ncbi:MAG: glutathione S-transferase family protein [Caulobacteraceae bacterium]
MSLEFIVHGAKGTGSVAVEAALTLLGLLYRVEEAPSLADRAAADAFALVNPMRQVPALILPSGELMTESAAILIWLADAHPTGGLAPPIDSRRRPAFLRWMTFVSAAVYSLYWIRDDPSRLVDDEPNQALLRRRIDDRISACWTIMESQVAPDPYLLGPDPTVLDLYLTVLSRWEPHRRAFYDAAPRMGEVVRRVDADPRLAGLWAARFPFVEGWEG